jgi:regulatory protein
MSLDENLLSLLNKAYFFLKFRPRSVWEVRHYLYKKIKSKHWSTAEADKVLEELKEEGLVDDKKFVDWFVEQRNASKPKSRFALKNELLRFGIAKDLIDQYFLDHAVDEEELALKALLPRWSRFRNLPSEKRFQKAAGFLLRRGFSFETVRATINKLEAEK